MVIVNSSMNPALEQRGASPGSHRGEVAEIWLADRAKEELTSVPRVRALAGRGLEGDRYSLGLGSFSRRTFGKAGQALSLIEIESLLVCQHRLAEELAGRTLTGGDLRRNVITRGVRLNDLVGATFKIGDAIYRGVRLCPPCKLLKRLTGVDVLRGLAGGRGGLRADILETGVIAVGYALEILSEGRGKLPA